MIVSPDHRSAIRFQDRVKPQRACLAEIHATSSSEFLEVFVLLAATTEMF
jgi:hypothetical protein